MTLRELEQQWRKEEADLRKRGRHLQANLVHIKADELAAVLDAQEGELAKVEHQMRAAIERLTYHAGSDQIDSDESNYLTTQAEFLTRWADRLAALSG